MAGILKLQQRPAFFFSVYIEAFDHECKVPFGTVIPAMVQHLFFDIIKQCGHKYAKPSPAVAADKTPVGAVAKNT